MKRGLLYCGFSGLAALSMGCGAAPKRSFTPADRVSITKVLDDQREAWNRGDIEAFMEGYAKGDELVFTSGSQIRRGWQVTLERYRARYGQDSSTMGKLGFELLGIQSLGADGAVVLGRWKLSGLESPAGGVFSVVLERRANSWRIVHDHTSSDPEAPNSDPEAPSSDPEAPSEG
jgi:ketosteroid isomerase-like protein